MSCGHCRNNCRGRNDWTIGKTLASIIFVFTAERYISSSNNADEIAKLRKRIDDIKSGNVVLFCRQAVTTFLRREED